MRRRDPLDRVPLIGVTTSRNRGWRMWAAAWLVLKLQGCRPIRIQAPQDDAVWEDLDGLLIGGGDDVEAELYGLEPLPNTKIDPERDALEMAGLAALWDSAMPILGTCRGSQIMNVFRGGTLHQDIYAAYERARRMRTVLPLKRVRLEPQTQLARIIGRGAIDVNALHNQSVDRLGDEMVVSGRDSGGVVQSTETKGDRFRIGVQWHPEFLFYRSAHWRLFRAFTDAAKAYAATKARVGAETHIALADSRAGSVKNKESLQNLKEPSN
ncbi:MAG: gamma-glutamyl-gamma-aminobutyrate hydrolase family protein [Neomegalonema sp.]|nr:gamma-glutamyl-gamma-aminobutyrate hydrolase family protein [Neomegalonema sp.]